MASESKAISLKTLIEGVPLKEILSMVVVVMKFVPIPGFSILSKILHVLIAVQPSATDVAGSIDKARQAVARSEEDKQKIQREQFDMLYAVAIADGEINNQEYQFLQQRAESADVSDDELELMCINYRK